MTISYRALVALAADVLTEKEIEDISQLLDVEPFNYQGLVQIDRQIGGPGFSNVSSHGSGRYHVDDADIFRPLQYCSMYFKSACEGSDAAWLTRTLVQMSCLHIEGLVKRLVGGSQRPLGYVLRDVRVQQQIDATLWKRLEKFTRIYNDAKHTISRSKDSHLFSVEDAILVYIIARKLAVPIYPSIKLYTDLAVFS